MKKQDKSFEDFFRESFEGAEIKPSTQLWENISNRLDGQETNKPAYYWWLGSVAASVVLLFIAYIALYNPFADSDVTKILANKSSIENKIENKSKNQGERKGSEEILAQKSDKLQKDENLAINPNLHEQNSQHDLKNSVANSTVVHTNINAKTQSSTVDTDTKTDQKPNSLKVNRTKRTNKQHLNQKLVANDLQSANTNKVLNEQSVIVKAGTNKNTESILLQTSETKVYELNLLKRIGFAKVPTHIAPAQVFMFPLSQPQWVVIKPSKIDTKHEISVTVLYGLFSPNFSNINEKSVPYPFITNADPRRGVVYDSSLIANDLLKLKNIASYAVMTHFNQNLYKGLGIQIGLGYTGINYEIEHTKFAFYEPSVNTGSASNIVYQKTALLNIPIALTYSLHTGKLVYGLQAGIQTDMLLQNSVTNKLASNGHVYNFGNYNTLNFNALAGFRIGYLVTPTISINAEINYRKALHSVYDTPYLQSNPQWLGFGTGLAYKF
jgi:hypothetical protein